MVFFLFECKDKKTNITSSIIVIDIFTNCLIANCVEDMICDKMYGVVIVLEFFSC